ncbi:hypothetical protein C8P67_111147 [Flavobacterium aquicola]|uniref:Uncharacterized protein n=1 Tax=Flavobacterium aquicola TaxID=1682742 RepID=A0A3E0EEK9_9FLAO|nr:hypothetical protein C8P67_111147 [Flavobacterium aquicola]
MKNNQEEEELNIVVGNMDSELVERLIEIINNIPNE